MVEWEPGKKSCCHMYSSGQQDASGKHEQCIRPVMSGYDLCPYHLDEDDRKNIDLNEDIRSRLEAIEAGDLNIEKEPLMFHDATFDTLDLSDLDLSLLSGRDIKLDFRNCTIKNGIRAKDLSVPFPIDLSGATIDGIKIDGSEIGGLNLEGAKISTDDEKAIQINNTTVNGDVNAGDCTVAGDVSITNGEYRAVRLRESVIQGNLIFSEAAASMLNLTGSRFHEGDVSILPKQIQNISGPRLSCRKLEVGASLSLGFDDRGQADGITAVQINLTNAIASVSTVIQDVDVDKLVATGFETPHLKCKSINVRPNQSSKTSHEDAIFKIRSGDIEQLEIVKVNANVLFLIEGVHGDILSLDRCGLAKFELVDAKLRKLVFQNTVCGDLSVESTEVVDGAKFIGELSERSSQTIGSKNRLSDIESRRAKFEDCSLQSLQYELQCTELCVTDCTVDGTAHIGYNTIQPPKEDESTPDSHNHRQIERLRINNTEFDELIICGTVVDCFLNRIAVANSTLFDNVISRSTRIVDSMLTSLNVDGSIGTLSVYDSELPKHTRINLRNGRFRNRSVYLTESTLNKLALVSDSPDRRIILDRTYVERKVRFNITGSNPQTTNSGPTIVLDDVRIDGKLRYEGCVVQLIEHTTTTIKNVDFEVHEGQIRIDHSQVSEMTTFSDCDLASLRIEKSRLEQFNLTSDSLTPVADEIVIDDATLPNAIIETEENSHLTRGQFVSRNATLRGANLTGLSAGGSITLAQSNLTDAQLRGASLTNADLSNVLLSRASLAGANLRYANLQGAVFGDVHLTEGTKIGVGKDKLISYDPKLESPERDLPSPDPKVAKAIYAQLKAVARDGGHSELARSMHKNEKGMKLMIDDQIRFPRIQKLGKRGWYWLTGYEIEPGRVLVIGLVPMSAIIFVLSAMVWREDQQLDSVFDAVTYIIGVFFSLEPGYYTPPGILQYIGPLLAGFGAVFVAALIYTIGQRSAL